MESGGIPKNGEARSRGLKCKTERTAGDGDWFLGHVSKIIIVSGSGADEVRFTGREN